jgi:DNA polymerase-3 subunit alpha
MDDYRQYLKKTHVLPIIQLTGEESSCKDEQIVSVAGIVQAIKMKTTRNNSMMAYVTMEDDTAAIELLAFSNVLKEYGGYLKENAPVVISGRVSLRDEKEPQIIVNRVRPITDFEEAPAQPQPSYGTLYLKLTGEDDPNYRKVRAIINMFPGETCVKVFFADTRRIRVAQAAPADIMLEELKNILGTENVVLK